MQSSPITCSPTIPEVDVQENASCRFTSQLNAAGVLSVFRTLKYHILYNEGGSRVEVSSSWGGVDDSRDPFLLLQRSFLSHAAALL